MSEVWYGACRLSEVSPATSMGPPFRHWDGTTSGATSADTAMMNDAVAGVKDRWSHRELSMVSV